MMHHPWSYEPPRRLDPVDRSIAALLQTLNAAHWTDWLPRRSSPEDVEAVEALLAVGFLEMKCSALLLQPGDRWGHEVQATFCGANGLGRFLEAVASEATGFAWGRETRTIEVEVTALSIRLAPDVEQVMRDHSLCLRHSPTQVCDFVRGLGLLSRRAAAEPWVRIERCERRMMPHGRSGRLPVFTHAAGDADISWLRVILPGQAQVAAAVETLEGPRPPATAEASPDPAPQFPAPAAPQPVAARPGGEAMGGQGAVVPHTAGGVDSDAIAASIVAALGERGVMERLAAPGVAPVVVQIAPHPDSGRSPVGAGMPFTEVLRLAEQHVRKHGGAFPGRNELARLIGCSPSSIAKAVSHSPYLKARAAEHRESRGGGREVQVSGSMDEFSDRGEAIEALIREQAADAARSERQAIARRRSRPS